MKYALYKRWSNVRFPWVQDNKWELVGTYNTEEECQSALNNLLPTNVYMYMIKEIDDNLPTTV